MNITKTLTTRILPPFIAFLKRFTTLQWFYQKITHSRLSTISLVSALILRSRKIDQGWKENLGAQGLSRTSTNISKTYQLTQTGYIKHYLLMSTCIITTIFLISRLWLL